MFVAESSQFVMKFFFLSYVLAMCYSQARYNVTVLLFIDESSDKFASRNDLHQMLHKDIFSRKSEVINFTWLKANHTGLDRCQGGVLGALSFIQNHFTTVHGAIFVDITKEGLAFSSLLGNVDILTIGLFQEDEILHTQVKIMHINDRNVVNLFSFPYSRNYQFSLVQSSLAEYFRSSRRLGDLFFFFFTSFRIHNHKLI